MTALFWNILSFLSSEFYTHDLTKSLITYIYRHQLSLFFCDLPSDCPLRVRRSQRTMWTHWVRPRAAIPWTSRWYSSLRETGTYDIASWRRSPRGSYTARCGGCSWPCWYRSRRSRPCCPRRCLLPLRPDDSRWSAARTRLVQTGLAPRQSSGCCWCLLRTPLQQSKTTR